MAVYPRCPGATQHDNPSDRLITGLADQGVGHEKIRDRRRRHGRPGGQPDGMRLITAVLRSVPGGTAASAEEDVRPSLNAGTTALDAFLAAIAAAPSSAPAATVTPAAVPSPSPTVCIVPDVVDDQEAPASSAVQAAGLRAAVVKKAYPNGPALPAGLVWATDPVPQREPCESTVTLYVQP